MIVRSKAPLRLGLAGGGSDVSPYSDMYGGLILNATINLYTYCTIEETNDGLITIDSDDAQCHESYPLERYLEIDGNASLIKGVYNRVIRDFDIVPRSFKITTYNDAPVGSGLGTSSAMVVCILKAFIEWLTLPLGDYEASRLAYEIERKDLDLSGGKQDQYAAAFGGFNFMEFLKNDLVIVNPLKIKRWIIDELEASMVLYFIGALTTSGLQLVADGYTWLIILGLALPATAISNITLVRAIKYAGPTLTSILGAMEPLTAVVIGVFVFKELFTLNSAIGIILILLAVSVVIFRKQKNERV